MFKLFIYQYDARAYIQNLIANGALYIFLELIMFMLMELKLNIEIIDFILQDHELRVKNLLFRLIKYRLVERVNLFLQPLNGNLIAKRILRIRLKLCWL